MDSLASRYATALLQIAVEKNQNSTYRQEIESILEIFEESNELKQMLESAFITKAEKKKVLSAILEYEEIDEIKNFILVIIDNARSKELFAILKEFVRLSNLEDEAAEGIVYSTSYLNKTEIERIANTIGSKLKKKIMLRNKLDSSLIGGIKVSVDGHIYDGSIRSKLKELKKQLKKGAN